MPMSVLQDGRVLNCRMIAEQNWIFSVFVLINRAIWSENTLIKYVNSIGNLSDYQRGELPENAQKLEAPASIEELMKKSMPIAVILCAVMILALFIKRYVSQSNVVFPPAVLGGLLPGFLLLIVHEWLHAIVYPKEAQVTIGKLQGKLVFLALASFPLNRGRFIVMCLLPFLLGIVPFVLFLSAPPQKTVFNGLMFGLACPGMVSPYPDVYNVILVLKQSGKNDKIMFYEDDIYCLAPEEQFRL